MKSFCSDNGVLYVTEIKQRISFDLLILHETSLEENTVVQPAVQDLHNHW